MSKSKGNVIDPLELIDDYGADALRFTLAAMAAQGRDIKLARARVEGYRNVGTKLWNAARFAEMNGVARDPNYDPVAARVTVNRWIAGEASRTRNAVTRAIEEHKYNEAAAALYQFVWNVYCDWYVELIKPILNGGDERAKAETRASAAWVLDQILLLLHPFMPFVTEEIWQALPHDGELLATAGWPRAKSAWFDTEAERQVAFLQELVVAVRNLRVENGLPAGRQVPVTVRGSAEQLDLVERLAGQIRPLARIESLTLARDGSRPAVAASAVVMGAEVFVPLEGLVDLEEERARLAREAGKLLGDLESTKKKLRNQDFLNKARPEIVEKERARLAALEETLEKLRRAQESLRAVQS
jgi:valyl-tRNA synthetase